MHGVRRTKSKKQAVERLLPFAEAIGFQLKYLGNGYWNERYLPAEKRYGDEGPLKLKTEKVLGNLVRWIRKLHPEGESVRDAVRWYGMVPLNLYWEDRQALEWLQLSPEELT
jgi:hypothetical protein